MKKILFTIVVLSLLTTRVQAQSAEPRITSPTTPTTTPTTVTPTPAPTVVTQPTAVEPTVTQPTTTPVTPTVTQPTVAPVATPTTQATATQTAATQPTVTTKKVKAARPSGYVKLYEHKGFNGLTYSLSVGNSAGDTDHVVSDQGSGNFKDKCSSVSYKIPAGWRVSLYEHTYYQGRAYNLSGTGSISDLGYMNDKCSSVRWEKN